MSNRSPGDEHLIWRRLKSKNFFLAVQNSSIGGLVTHWVTDSLRTLLLDRKRATLETCDLWDMWSEWWGDIWDIRDIWDYFDNLTIWQFRQFWQFWQSLMTCDIWETDYNSDNWDPEFITIFVAWQLRVTLDSIRNSCDVFFIIDKRFLMLTCDVNTTLCSLFERWLWLWTGFEEDPRQAGDVQVLWVHQVS